LPNHPTWHIELHGYRTLARGVTQLAASDLLAFVLEGWPWLRAPRQASECKTNIAREIAMTTASKNFQVFEIDNLTLQRGMTLPSARIAYQTYGQLADDKSNVILYPTSYGAQHLDTEWLIGPGRVLDPSEWFIVIPNMFTNGLSTSPSNLEAPFGRDRHPVFTHWDNVHAQRRLLAEVFGVERLALRSPRAPTRGRRRRPRRAGRRRGARSGACRRGGRRRRARRPGRRDTSPPTRRPSR
jgi:hypothetical protein